MDGVGVWKTRSSRRCRVARRTCWRPFGIRVRPGLVCAAPPCPGLRRRDPVLTTMSHSRRTMKKNFLSLVAQTKEARLAQDSELGCIRDRGSCDRRQRRKRANPHSPRGRHKAGGCGGKSCSSRGEMPTFGQPGPEPLLRSSESVLLGRRLYEGVEGGMLPHPRLQHPAPDPSQDPQTPALSAQKTVEQDPPPDPSLRP